MEPPPDLNVLTKKLAELRESENDGEDDTIESFPAPAS